MTFALGFLAALVLALILIGLAYWIHRVRTGLAQHIGRTVVIHQSDKLSIKGVLKGSYADGCSLGSPEWMSEAQPRQLGGEVFVPAKKIAFFQVLASEG